MTVLLPLRSKAANFAGFGFSDHFHEKPIPDVICMYTKEIL